MCCGLWVEESLVLDLNVCKYHEIYHSKQVIEIVCYGLAPESQVERAIRKIGIIYQTKAAS